MHQNRPPLPVDRGWAWFVMLGAFTNLVFSFGFIRSLSIFFLEFLDKFQESAAMTTLAFGLNTAAYSASAILVSPIFLSRFSVRTVTLIGAALNAVSITALAFAPNMIFIDIIFTALGFSYPLIYISQTTLLAVYFDKKLSFAFAFANLGISIATMGAPALTQWLLDEYGLHGALLIHGALNFHNFAACLLFRPPSLYSFPFDSDKNGTRTNVNTPEVEIEQESKVELFNSIHDVDGVCCTNNVSNDNIMLVNVTDGDRANVGVNAPLIQKTHHPENDIFAVKTKPKLSSRVNKIHRSKSLVLLNDNMGGSLKNCTGCDVNISVPKLSMVDISLKHRSKLNIIDVISSSKSIEYLGASSSCLYGTHNLTIYRSIQHSLGGNHDGPMPKSPMYLQQEKTDTLSTSNSITQDDERTFCSFFSSLKNTIKNSVFCHPFGIILVLMAGFGANTQCAVAYMPSLGKEQGVQTHQLPYLMTIIGACDLCKIGFGLLADQGWVRRIHIVLFCELVIGVSFQFASFFHGFVPMAILGVLLGANSEVVHVLVPSITVDLLGTEYVGQILSGYSLVNGVVLSLTHVLVGWMKDETGSFIGGYNFMGGLYLFSASVIVLQTIISGKVRGKVETDPERPHQDE